MGDYFTTKDEAIQCYKSNYKNLEDKPDWLVDSLIDFCIRYPDYKEYIEVEHKIKSNIELSDYEKRIYGELDWKKKLTTYKKNEIINDSVDILDAGEYDDLKDPQVREKMNKYGLDFGQLLEPSPYVKIKMTSKDETTTFTAPVEDLNRGIHSTWTIEEE
jgi:hypothetical protein